jgi:MFS family permease
MNPIISLFLFVLVDILGFSIILPLFPYLSKQYGMTPTQIGLLQTSNALAQLFAVPIIGILSDKYGRRPLLLLCLVGTFVSFIILWQGL